MAFLGRTILGSGYARTRNLPNDLGFLGTAIWVQVFWAFPSVDRKKPRKTEIAEEVA